MSGVAAPPAPALPADEKREMLARLLARKAARPQSYPLSFAQQRLWFLDRMSPGTDAYNVWISLGLPGPLDRSAFRASLREIVRRHATLRTTFTEVDGEILQVVSATAEPALLVIDLSALPAGCRKGEAHRLAAACARAPFDLGRGPLLRTFLLEIEREESLAVAAMHHIVSDAASTEVLLRELQALYGACSAGRPSPLPPLPIQYTDYARWQRQLLQGETLEQQIAYWKERLRGLPVLEMPTDRPRTPAQSFRGAARTFTFPAALREALGLTGQREGATPFMVLLATLAALLHRYTGQEEICIGTPVTHRERPELQGLIGFFVNTLALRVSLAGDPRFRELLGRVRETALGAYAHQDLPFERLVEELQPERDASRSVLFQVAFSLQHLQDAPSSGASPQVIGRGAVKFELTFEVSEGAWGVRGLVEYNRDLFDPSTLARLLGHLRTLAEGAASHPEARLSELPLLSSAEVHQLRHEWNDTAAAPASGPSLSRQLEAWAERSPHAVAAAFEGGTVRFAELNARANRLARHLRRLGVRPETRVGVCLERSVDLIVAALGVFKAGGAYVPFDPQSPDERLRFLLADALGSRETAVLITRRRLADRFDPAERGALHLVDLEAGGDLLARESPENLEEAPSADHLAYVIYTSGSTGQPKGVEVSHGALANLVSWHRRAFGVGPEDRATLLAGVGFDASLWEIWPYLSAGASLHIPPGEIRGTPAALRDWLTAAGITIAFVPTVLAEELLRLDWPAEAALRSLLTGGDRLLSRPGPHLPFALINNYGPTENAVVTTSGRVEPTGVAGRAPSLGWPVDHVEVRLLDRSFRPVPIGVAGELCTGGAQLARGYRGQPGLTAERFVPDPGGLPGARLYRTGDLARYLPDGAIEFLGRIDHQVKIRGFRIELGEIEAALSALSGVREAVVAVREDVPGEKRLVAYVAGSAAPDALRQALRDRLPDYMVPAAFVMLPALPLTPNGKVDRKALPAPQAPSPESVYQAPRTPVEEILATVWAEILGVERVGAADSFFELGGHSLLATRVVSRLRGVFGIEMPLRDLFEAPTLAGLAARVEAARRAGAGLSAPPLVPLPRTGPSPLSFAQQRLWFLDQLEPGSPLYNLPVALRVSGPLDSGILARALGEIVRRHEALRTTFAELEGSPVQVIRPAEPFGLCEVDLSGLPESGRQALALALTREEAGRPFDLTRGPLLRGAVLRLAEEDHILALTLHHIASDGWSMGILVREVTALYAAFAEGRPSPLPELPVQYADFAAWQRGWLRGAVLEEQLAWWKRQLSGAPASLDLPMEHPRPALRTSRGGTATRRLSPELCRRLEELGHREGTTPFMSLLAALAALLHRYTGQDDLVVGTPIAGRTRAETEGLIGFFLNTLALRIDLSGDPTVRELLGRTRETVLGASDHQDVPFELLLEELRPERDLSRTPLFQVVLNWLGFGSRPEEEGPGLPGLTLERLPGSTPPAKFDLEIYAGPGAGEIVLFAVYSRDLFGPSQIDDLLAHLEALLDGLTAGAARRVSELPLAVDRSEGRRPPVPAAGSIPERFAAQAMAHAGRPAVVAAEGTWTYAELAREADRVAHALLAKRGAREGRVALLFSPGLPMVAAVLGALAAGAAYVPLDPSHPRERLLDVLADCEADALLAGDDQRALAAKLDAALPVLFFGELPPAPPGWAPPPVAPETPAYLLYTSGSTGRPKGVLQSQKNVLGHIRTYGQRLGLGPEDRVLLLARYGFDAAVMDLFGALLHGAALCLWDLGVHGFEGLSRWIAGQAVTVYHSTPTVYRAFLESVDPGESFPALRLVVLGGEEARRQDFERFREVFAPGCRLVNGLGPTESTLALQRFLEGDERITRAGLPVGWPVEETRVRLRHGAGEQPAVWGIGEIEICSPYLALGYWRQPDLTAGRFLPDPDGEPGARLYRTGDLARRLPEGEIEFLGRIDHQVKIRGVRVEPGEIEAALLALSGVREAVVAVREDVPGEKRLAAYVVGDAAPDALRQALRERLPDAMVPAVFVTLAALPLTPNGKVDRRALPAPQIQSPEEGYLAPRTPVEEILAAIWAGLLGVERVGAAGHFFELGGHSLLATRVVSRLRSVFGVDMPLRDLFEAPTLAGLAARVEAARRAGAGLLAPPLAPVPRQGPLPLSFAQQRLWFLDQLAPGSPLYNMPVALRIEGPLDRRILARSLGEIARRHEALRTVFAEREGAPVQVIRPAAPFGLSVADLSELPEKEREARALALVTEETGRPFDLARGPLLRAVLLRMGEQDHVAVLTMHHIVSDAWSMGILVREVTALYAAFAEGRPSPLPELPAQYADFSAWQQSWLSGGVLESEIAYWRRQLANLPPRLELPTDRPRPAAQSFRGALRPARLSPGLNRRLQALGRHQGATLFMVLLAGFQALLSRSSGQQDLAVGTPISGRNRVEVEGLIGFFVNTLVLRGDLAGGPTFRELLGRVRDTALAAHAHQDVPFEKLVQELAPERSLSHAPLFQAMLVLQNAPVESLEIRDLRLRPVGQAAAAAKFDLTLSLQERGGEISGGLEFNRDLFDPTTIHRLLSAYERLLESAAADPDRSVAELPLLSPAELHQVQREWNPAGEAPGTSLVERFEAWADRTPEAVAVLAPDEDLTYAELERRANQLARHLQKLGVRIDSRVGLCAERSPETIVAVLGILKAGAAYVPLDPAYPRERLAFLIEDSRVPVLLTQERLLASLPERAAVTLCLDTDWSPIARESGERLPHQAVPESLAYVIYTSGSTGRPKGVLVHHRGWSNLAEAQGRLFDVRPGSRVLQFASLGFDASASEIAMALGSGATLLLGPRERVLSAEELKALLRQSTVATLPPTTLAVLEPEDLPGLETLVVAGEACPPEVARRWAAGRRLFNAYGPTEASVCATAQLYDGGERLPIGRPLERVQAYVLDREGQHVPIGVAGELHAGGPGVARGYLHRPELTAGRFVPDPFGPAGARLYRTGDLARFLPDGTIEFLGRIDHQVKIRGFRVELGEIEAALSGLPGVREAIVVAREEAPGDRRLVAYVAGEAEPDALRQALRERLPDPMVPAAFVMLAALPLTPNGKVDRKALPAPQGPGPEESRLAPRTPVEEILAALWSELLGVERIGAADSFFELGGHSLLAIRLMSRLRGLFGVEMPLRELFEAPTLAGLAARVEAARRTGGGRPVPPLVPVPRDRRLPLSFAQQRLWFLHQLDPGSPAYNMPFAFRLSGPLAVPALAASLSEVVRRHETLRTTLVLAGEEPVQEIAPPGPQPLPVLDLADLPAAEREELALELGLKEAVRPFDLARLPAVRTLLLRLSESNHVLLFTIHHVSGDGWSLDVLTRELAELYAAAVEGRPARLPRLPVQYADFAVWQRSWLEGEVLEEQIDYWRRQLAGAPSLLEMPLDRPRPPVQSTRGARSRLRLPDELATALLAFGRSQGATGFMTVLAGFQALLHRYSGQASVVVGTPIANRGRAELEGLIGFFANTLALRADFSGGPGFTGLLGQVREASLGAYAHQDLPFEKLVDELAPQRDMSYGAVFQALFVYQNAPQPTASLSGLALRPLGTDEAVARFDLTLACAEAAAGLAFHLDYNADLFEAATAGRMLRLLAHLLAGLVAEPERPIGEIPLLDEIEHRQVVLAPNATAHAREEEELSLHGLFARQAARTPGAPAVVAEDGVVPYGDLAGWAGRIAERLRRLGVGPEDRVGVCLERSAAALASFLGALAAGATYVPLDPEWPRERLAAVAADAGLSAMLSRAGLPAGEGLAPREVWVEEVRRGAPAGISWARPATPEAAAYIIYTSGSTGAAKGVVISHRAAANFVLALGETLGLSPADRLLLFAPLSFDASVLQIFPALSRGAAVAVHADPRELAGDGLPGFCERHGVTVLDLPAALWRQWIEDMAAQGRTLPAGIRTYLTGGESVPVERVRAWAGMTVRPAAFLSSYGPTEATVTATVFLTDSGAAPSLPAGKVPIGRPLANVRAYVLDARRLPVPEGVAGELYLGGDGLARGYLGRPGLTAASFLPDAVGGTAGGRLYRTGDLARRLPGGDLEFLGRADTQVKIRGFRLELSEVEAVLGRHPDLAECVVTVREDRPGDRRLVAYAVPQPGRAPGVPELRAFVAERLPQYMVPAAFVTLGALPVLASGKVDRAALPAPESDRPGLGSSFSDPRTPAEEALAAIWAQVLGLDRVGVHDNFFELGGDSILSIQILARANQRGLRLTARQIFEHPTVASLARAAASAPALVAEQGIVTGPVPLTPIQRWFFAEGFSAPHHFNQAVVLDVAGPLAPATLERAAAAVLLHHDALRMRFPREDGVPRQENAGPGAAVPLAWIDLSALPEGSRPAARAQAQDAIQASFDLERGPLTRLALFDAGEGGQRLLWAAHHLVVDGVSWRVLVEDLETACRHAPLPAKTTPFRAWAERLIGHARSGGFGGELPYWTGAALRPAARLPVDFPGERAANTLESGLTVHVTLTPEETRTLLQTVASTYRTQINDALLAALARAFAGWTRSPSLLVDLEGHGREPLFDDVDLSRTVGWFTTHFPVRLDLEEASGAVAALLAVKEQLRRVPGRGLGYGLLVQEGGEEAAPLRAAPPVEVSFNYLGQFDQAVAGATLLRLTGEPAGTTRDPRSHRTHLIEVSGLVAGGQLRVSFIYSANLHRRETIERLAASFGRELRDLIARSLEGEEAALTPSDFPLNRLSEKSFHKLSALLDDEE